MFKAGRDSAVGMYILILIYPVGFRDKRDNCIVVEMIIVIV